MAFRWAKKVVQPSWHPNFRSVETLPDIKVIRTDFFVNLFSLTIGVALLFYFFYMEYRLFSLKWEIDQYEQKIGFKQAADARHLGLSADFARLEKELEEINRFKGTPVKPAEFLMDLSGVIPREILLQSIKYGNRQSHEGRKTVITKAINLTGSVSGNPEEATQLVTDFIHSIEELDLIEGILKRINLISMVRDPNLGLFSCSIRIELNAID